MNLPFCGFVEGCTHFLLHKWAESSVNLHLHSVDSEGCMDLSLRDWERDL